MMEMNINTMTLMDLIVDYTEKTQKCLLVIRTVGPDACTDADKVNKIYSAYKNNMDEENTGVFNTFMRNEWSFLEFETEAEAVEYYSDNLPLNKADTDPDYFVQFWLFNTGAFGFTNDNLAPLSHRVPIRE